MSTTLSLSKLRMQWTAHCPRAPCITPASQRSIHSLNVAPTILRYSRFQPTSRARQAAFMEAPVSTPTNILASVYKGRLTKQLQHRRGNGLLLVQSLPRGTRRQDLALPPRQDFSRSCHSTRWRSQVAGRDSLACSLHEHSSR